MDALLYKCPSCGAELKFNPQTQGYKCDYCLLEYSQEELDAKFAQQEERALNESAQNEHIEDVFNADENTAAEQALLYNCPNCGAQIVTDQTTAATFCYYCHSPVILSGRLDGADTPDYVIPFEIDRNTAQQIFSAWITKKKYVPKDFYSNEQIDKLSGVYFPYILYNCRIHACIDATAQKNSVRRIGNTEYTDIDSYHIKKEGDMDLNNIARNALKKANKVLVEGVLPYDFAKAVQFKMSYLSGFMAERKDMQVSDFEKNIEAEVHSYAMQKLDDYTAGYSDLNIFKKEAAIIQDSWKYALMPVWTLTYNDRKNNKIYYFSINGQKGNVIGKLPVDSKKLMIHFLLIAAFCMVIFLLFSYFIL